MTDCSTDCSAAVDAVLTRVYKLYDDAEEVSVKAEHEAIAPVAHGWLQHSRRTGLAALKLHSIGFGHECAPLLRSLLEHALALAWLTDANKDAFISLLRAQRVSFEKLQKAMDGGNWTATEEDIQAAIGDPLPLSSQDHMLQVQNRLERYGSKELQVAWLLETALSHPTILSAQPYVESTSERQITLLQEPDNETDVPRLVTAFLLLACDNYHKILYGAPWESELRSINEDLGNS